MRKGLTILEILIALAVLGIAFAALLTSQISSLRTSAQSRFASDTKAFAVQVLEDLSAQALRTETSSTQNTYTDEERGGVYRSFYFIDYYYGCPTPVTPPTGSGIRTALRTVACSGQRTSPEGIRADWDYIGEGGRFGEGVLTVVVTATHPKGPRVTVGRRITCYDVYPSPTHDKPRPCPEPGGGRP
ncbi:type II secretion system protein [Thermus sp.]|uniref:type IV pilus modification PilV family protein n=1 Tax=Thermus sp. TaxID=275 RepID=UPI00307EC88F